MSNLMNHELETARRAAQISLDPGAPEHPGIRAIPGRIAVAPVGEGRVVLAVRGLVQVLAGDDAVATAAFLLDAVDPKPVVAVDRMAG